MKLIITGGGDSKHFHKIDSHFISLLRDNPNLLFIPLAGDEDSWNTGLERIAETFSTIDFENIEMCLNLEELDWEYLEEFDAIYIDGGNTFQLMSKIRHTHAFELFHRFLHHGGVINGDSAGAIVLGSHIETAHFGSIGDENLSGVISYQGLNLLGNWAIHCHYNSEENNEIEEFVEEFGFPVISLHEESAAYIEDTKLSVIGKKPVVLFSGESPKTIKPGQTVDLME